MENSEASSSSRITDIPPTYNQSGCSSPNKAQITQLIHKHKKGKYGRSTLLRCSDCEFQTDSSSHLKRHESCHLVKSAHKCPLCTFSFRRGKEVYFHLKFHHSKNKDRDELLSKCKPFVRQAIKSYYAPNGRKLKFLHCGDCDYKSSHRFHLIRHVKIDHPSSKTALQPLMTKTDIQTIEKLESAALQCTHCQFQNRNKSEFEKHVACHERKSTYQCSLCSYSVSLRSHLTRHLTRHHSGPERDKALANYEAIVQRGEWYYPPNGGQRIRYNFCSDCDYKTKKLKVLSRHMKKMHPYSIKPLPIIKRAPKNQGAVNMNAVTLLKCADCEHRSTHHAGLRLHRIHHEKKSAHSCPLCNYTAVKRWVVELHLKRDHSGSDRDAILTDINKPEDWYVAPGGAKRKYLFCSECDYKSCSNYLLLKHLRKNHPSSSSISSLESVKTRILRCDHCEYVTHVKSDMEIHMDHHLNESKYQCRYCSYSVKSYHNLAVHMRKDHSKRDDDDFNLRECRVVLVDIFPTKIDELTAPQKEEIISLRVRIYAMEKKVRTADEELKRLSNLKNKICGKKEALILMSSKETDSKLVHELSVLREEEDEIAALLEEEEGSYMGAAQVLLALQSDLKRLLLP